MKSLSHIKLLLLLLSLLGLSCGASKVSDAVSSKKKPQWVQQRPTNTQFYIGIGYASKISNAGDFQRVAKKYALDDMMGEIKVTVSSNSVLSQQQNNQNFNQQFFSDTRMVASETMEGYQVLDSWENKEEYWIYYRLSKADFEAYKRKKIYEATQKALDFMYRADKMSLKQDYVSIFKLRVRAAASLQNYLNESIETEYYGKNVFLLNEILSQLQDQLYMIRFSTPQTSINVTAGKALDRPIEASAAVKTKDSLMAVLAYLPLKAEGNGLKFKGTAQTETQGDGVAQFSINSIQSTDAIQVLRIKTDIDKLLLADSLISSMRKLIVNLEGPVINIRMKVEPIKLFIQSKERNLDQPMAYPILEPALKKKLMAQGCLFVDKKQQADYVLVIEANTKDQGVMWGNMLRASIEMNIVLLDATSNNELMHDALSDIVGYQTTKEKAGVEAYLSMRSEMMKKSYPAIYEKLFPENY
ncbi:MAG: LPP20 family lipoprotein [bacterium]|nr:LPP20 family lipoprotein [bacterium]